MNLVQARYFFCFLLMFLGAIPSIGMPGNETDSYGPRGFACGRVSGPFRDVWSVQNNPGALGYLTGNAAAVSMERRFSAFSLLSFAAAFRNEKLGTFGLGISRFGPDFFSQSRAGISWGRAFGIAALGLQAQWYQVSASQTATRHYLLVNFGGIGKLGEKVFFSGTVSNLTQTRAGDYTGKQLPTVLKAGLSVQPNANLALMAELQKDLDEDAGINAGLEYRIAKAIQIRTGFSTATGSGSIGFGISWRDFQLDGASSWHSQLGFSHCFGISYLFPAGSNPKAVSAK